MAQIFVPLWLANPNGGAWPTAFKGNRPDANTAETLFAGPAVNGSSAARDFVHHSTGSGTGSLSLLLGLNVANVNLLMRSRLSPLASAANNGAGGPIQLAARVNASSWINDGGAGDGSIGRPSNMYYFTNGTSTFLTSSSSQRSFQMWKISGGATTQLGSTATNQIAWPSDLWAAPYVLMRLECTGTTIRGRAWFEGDAEPGTWAVSVTDADHASGDVGIIYRQNNQRFAHSWLSVGTDGDPPLTSPPMNVIAGTLRNPSGNLVGPGYVVRCYHQESGAMLGETVTDGSGAWSFTVPTTDAVYVLAVDNLGNTWKAPINDRLSPVA